MGTRHLVQVDYQDEVRIAQYGQRDGYPEGQGKTIYHFLKGMDLDKFKKELLNVRFRKEDEHVMVDKIWAEDLEKPLNERSNNYFAWTRDTGAGILQLVHDGKVTLLGDERAFKDDKLFCEWYRYINLDNMTLSVNDRWVFNIEDLPDTEQKFIKLFYNSECSKCGDGGDLENMYNRGGEMVCRHCTQKIDDEIKAKEQAEQNIVDTDDEAV